MIIYKITNTCNNKVYIGQTQLTINERFNQHRQQAKHKVGTHLYNAIRKYGIDQFNIELLECCDTLDELNRCEIYWISLYSSNNRKHGYNLTSGGDGVTGFKHSKYTKNMLSKMKSGVSVHTKQEKHKRKLKWLQDKNPNYVNVDRVKLLKCIKHGLNNQELARVFSCTPPTIIEKIKQYFKCIPNELRKRMKIVGNRKQEYKPIDFLLLTELIKSGILRKDIAKRLKISEPQLNLKIKTKYGFGFSQLKQEINNGNI